MIRKQQINFAIVTSYILHITKICHLVQTFYISKIMTNMQLSSNIVVDTSKQLVNQSKPDGIDILFQNITYSVKIQDNSIKSKIPFKKSFTERQILKGISGIFKSGRVTAIMGASGAGKTTLLNILACRIKPSKGGKLYANTLEYSYETFGNFANYVMQNDLLMQTLTVRETLQFAAKLKLSHQSEEERKKSILRMAKEMKLQKCLDTLVGGVLLKGVSGGQRKRTSIAFQLISDPQVIFLDEPTSGLDSLTSYIICSELRKLAHKTNKTVIMTIHQPNSQTYELFDDLMILLQGKLIYQSSASNVTDYFEKHFNLKCPLFMNPPDFFMSKIHYEDQKNREFYPKYFLAYETFEKSKVQETISTKQTSQVSFRQTDVKFSIALRALLHRSMINTFRNPRLVRVKLIQAIFMALYIGGMFFDVGQKDFTNSEEWMTITGFLFFVSIFSMTMSISPISLTFPAQRLVFVKQQDSKMYTTSQYFLARNIIQWPQHFIIPLITVAVYYFMVGLSNTGGQFFLHCLNFALMSFCGASLGLLVGSVILDEKDVAAIIPIFLLPMITFSGFFKNRADLPKWIGWIEYLSPNKYSFIGLLENEVAFKESLIDQLKFDLSKWQAIGILFVLGVAFRLLSFFFLWFLRKKNE